MADITSSYAESEFPQAISKDLFEGAIKSWSERTLAPRTAYGEFETQLDSTLRARGLSPEHKESIYSREDISMSTPEAIRASSREYGPRSSTWANSGTGKELDDSSGPSGMLTHSLSHHLMSENIPHQKINISERDTEQRIKHSETRHHSAVSFLVEDNEGRKQAMIVNPDIARYDTSAPLYEPLHEHISRLNNLGLQLRGFGSDSNTVRDGKLVDDSQQFREDQIAAFNMGDEQAEAFNSDYRRGYIIPENLSSRSRSGIFHSSKSTDVDDLELNPKKQSGRLRFLR